MNVVEREEKTKRLHIRIGETEKQMLDYVTASMRKTKSDVFRKSVNNVYLASKNGFDDCIPDTNYWDEKKCCDLNVRLTETDLGILNEARTLTGKSYSDVFRDGLMMLYDFEYEKTTNF